MVRDDAGRKTTSNDAGEKNIRPQPDVRKSASLSHGFAGDVSPGKGRASCFGYGVGECVPGYYLYGTLKQLSGASAGRPHSADVHTFQVRHQSQSSNQSLSVLIRQVCHVLHNLPADRMRALATGVRRCVHRCLEVDRMLPDRRMSVLSLMCGGLRRYHQSLLVTCR